MRAARHLALAALGLAVVGAALAAGDEPLRHVYPKTLPEGRGLEVAGKACLMCHSSMLIAQQHKDSTAWEQTLTTMVNWGAPLTPGERDTLRAYLVRHFGPRR